jgi:hypothetical protein
MKNHRWSLGAILLGFLMCASTAAAGGSAQDSLQDAGKLAARIDALIDARLAEKKVQPAPPTDDAEFLRRVYLDLAGRIPPAFEVREFLADPSPDKRARVVERLLESAGYVNHFSNVWRALLLPQTNNPQVQPLVPGFEAWLRQRIRNNVPFDRLVREIVTGPTSPRRAMRGRSPRLGEPTPAAFYKANERKPENLASNTSRLFLGIKLECAQCHNHPTDHWTRTQFWEYAAFFAGIRPESPGTASAVVQEVSDVHEIKIPGGDRVVAARYLDGHEPRWTAETWSRSALAAWLTAAENPYFARATANRVWAHLFGIGIVEPVDDFCDQNPPSHPEVLEELARQLTAHHFDVKFLIRALTATQAYQRTSAAGRTGTGDAADPRLFARMAVKSLSPEQLFDSLAQATGYRADGTATASLPGSPRAEFLARFANPDKPTEAHTSILQALALMNGNFVADATSVERSRTLAAVADAPFLDPAAKVEALYLATLSRKARPEEAARLVQYVTNGGPRQSEAAALADIFWALLNSAEFMLNH